MSLEPMIPAQRRRPVLTRKVRRRWTATLRDEHGTAVPMTVEVPATKGDGRIWVRAGDGRRYALDPATLSKIRSIYAEAIAVSLLDRGEW